MSLSRTKTRDHEKSFRDLLDRNYSEREYQELITTVPLTFKAEASAKT
jgi:hypothetical protein